MASFAPVDDSLASPSPSSRKVAYFYDADVGLYQYSQDHPMRPWRVRMTHNLVVQYDLPRRMEVYRARPATALEMTRFHTDDYIDFLRRVTPETVNNFHAACERHAVGDQDCPVFDGMFGLAQISAGGSMEAAARINIGDCDTAINWAGGLHHAKKDTAGGFCYVNDIVLGILELLRVHRRVLYIDIDIHHGDAVEEAFYTTDRVMTLSFHKHGDGFYPLSGSMEDVGIGRGKNYAINVPLRDGIDDSSYKFIFESVVSDVMTCYAPEAVVLQCGADSLSGDQLGVFNLSMRGHANCVKFVQSFRLPVVLLGGGGYSPHNVARAWAFETGVALGQDLSPIMPFNEDYEQYGPDFQLDVRASNMTNHNSRAYLENLRATIRESLRSLPHVPSVQMQDSPRSSFVDTIRSTNLALGGARINPRGSANTDTTLIYDQDEDENPDQRLTQTMQDRRIVPATEVEDSEDEDNTLYFEEDRRPSHLSLRPFRRRSRGLNAFRPDRLPARGMRRTPAPEPISAARSSASSHTLGDNVFSDTEPESKTSSRTEYSDND